MTKQIKNKSLNQFIADPQNKIIPFEIKERIRRSLNRKSFS